MHERLDGETKVVDRTRENGSVGKISHFSRRLVQASRGHHDDDEVIKTIPARNDAAPFPGNDVGPEITIVSGMSK